MFFDVIFYFFLLVVGIQIAYYLILFRGFAFSKPTNLNCRNIPVSVIICAKNESQNLRKFVPFVAKQDYPDFEIVLVNDASRDDSLEVMEALADKYQNIKIVNVQNNEAFWANKKYALTLGIKAAKHDFLIFTDADCKPVSNLWIQELANCFSKNKSIVLGYGAYEKSNPLLLNKLIRFETLLTAIQYFSFAKIGLPYMGVGRNLAYRKDEFFKVNGFISHMDINSGDDDLFVNQVANNKNTAICYTSHSFTKSLPKTSFKDWVQQKRRHVHTAVRYKTIHKFLLANFYLSQILFWVLGVFLMVLNHKLQIVLPLFLIVVFIKYMVVGYSAKKLNESDLTLLFPFWEILIILFQFSLFIINLVSKPRHWK